MPASAATARTVTPPGPSRTRTASAAATSSRSTFALGVRDRRPASGFATLIVDPPGVVAPLDAVVHPLGIATPPGTTASLDICRTTLHSYSTTFYRRFQWQREPFRRPGRAADAGG